MSSKTANRAHILYLVGEDSQGREVLRRPLTGTQQPLTDEKDENDNLVHQIAVLVVGLDWTGQVLAVIPHKPSGTLQTVTGGGLGQTMPLDDEVLLERVACFLLGSPADEMKEEVACDIEQKLCSHGALDQQAVLERLGLVPEDRPEEIFAGLLQLFLDGFFTPLGARQFAAALVAGYQQPPVG